MSRAYKCDRCGALNDRGDYGIDSLYIGRRPFYNSSFDLCPTCQKELEKWFACSDNSEESEFIPMEPLYRLSITLTKTKNPNGVQVTPETQTDWTIKNLGLIKQEEEK